MRKFLLTLVGVGLTVALTISLLHSEANDPQILPGSPFYQPKLFLESIQVALTPTISGRVQTLLTDSDERVKEAVKLIDQGESWRLSDSFRPMRVELTEADSVADQPTTEQERNYLNGLVAAKAITLQSNIYDLRPNIPDQNLVSADFNIDRTDAMAEADIAKSHYVHTALSGGSSNLALGPQSGVVLGASDQKIDYSPWIAVIALLLIPFAFFVPGSFKKIFKVIRR